LGGDTEWLIMIITSSINFLDIGLATPRILDEPESLIKRPFKLKKAPEFQRYKLTMDKWFHTREGYHSHSKRPAHQPSGRSTGFLSINYNYYSHWELLFIEYLDQYDIKAMALPFRIQLYSTRSTTKSQNKTWIGLKRKFSRGTTGFIDDSNSSLIPTPGKIVNNLRF